MCSLSLFLFYIVGCQETTYKIKYNSGRCIAYSKDERGKREEKGWRNYMTLLLRSFFLLSYFYDCWHHAANSNRHSLIHTHTHTDTQQIIKHSHTTLQCELGMDTKEEEEVEDIISFYCAILYFIGIVIVIRHIKHTDGHWTV